jgi:hypothetical protein
VRPNGGRINTGLLGDGFGGHFEDSAEHAKDCEIYDAVETGLGVPEL